MRTMTSSTPSPTKTTTPHSRNSLKLKRKFELNKITPPNMSSRPSKVKNTVLQLQQQQHLSPEELEVLSLGPNFKIAQKKYLINRSLNV